MHRTSFLLNHIYFFFCWKHWGSSDQSSRWIVTDVAWHVLPLPTEDSRSYQVLIILISPLGLTRPFSSDSGGWGGAEPHVFGGVCTSDCYLQKKLWIWLSDAGSAIINIVIGHLSVLCSAALCLQEAPHRPPGDRITSLINLNLRSAAAPFITPATLPTQLISSSFRAAAPAPGSGWGLTEEASEQDFTQRHPPLGWDGGADLLYINLSAKLVCHVNQTPQLVWQQKHLLGDALSIACLIERGVS